MAVRFSPQETLEGFLENNYSDPEELKIIRGTFERLRNEYSALATPEKENPELIVATGSSGAGKTTFLRALCEEPNSNRVLIDPDTIRDNLSLFTNTIEKHRNKGLSLRDADKIAYGKYRNASLYIFHSLFNHFCENNYNVTISFMPESLPRGVSSMIERAQEEGHLCEAIMLNAPVHELLESILVREKEIERAANPSIIKSGHKSFYTVALSLLDTSFPCQFYYREKYNEEPALALSKDGEGLTTVEDEGAYEGLLDNMPAYERKDFVLEVDRRSSENSIAFPALD